MGWEELRRRVFEGRNVFEGIEVDVNDLGPGLYLQRNDFPSE